jgi:uncharacterized membrane protein YccC
VPDLLPAFITGVRVFATIVAIELFWIASTWPNGATAIAFAAIGIILFSPREGQGYSEAMAFTLGIALVAPVAAVVKFAVLPGMESFASLAVVIGCVLVPLGILTTQTWQTSVFKAMAIFFCMLLMPTNVITYNTIQFHNMVVAAVVGMGSGAIAMLLLPPLSPAARTRRTLDATLRDFRRLASGKWRCLAADWENCLYHRLSELPADVDPTELARFVAMLSMGTTIIRLRRLGRRFDLETDLETAFKAIADGDIKLALRHLVRLDLALAAVWAETPGPPIRLRARGRIRALSEVLVRHRAYLQRSVQGLIGRLQRV